MLATGETAPFVPPNLGHKERGHRDPKALRCRAMRQRKFYKRVG
jgi:hypothetical protein